MRIGVVSDTHNHLGNVTRIVALFAQAGVPFTIASIYTARAGQSSPGSTTSVAAVPIDRQDIPPVYLIPTSMGSAMRRLLSLSAGTRGLDVIEDAGPQLRDYLVIAPREVDAAAFLRPQDLGFLALDQFGLQTGDFVLQTRFLNLELRLLEPHIDQFRLYRL